MDNRLDIVKMNLLSIIKQALNPPKPDPKRFESAIPYVPNFHGELEGLKRRGSAADRVRVSDGGNVEFLDNDAFAGIEIPAHLTADDVLELRKKRLDPQNPAYAKAKAYFSKNPACSKEQMAAESGMGIETAKDVVAGFRRNILKHNPSPTTETPLF